MSNFCNIYMSNFCSNCGIKVNPNWHACPDCGNNLIGVKSVSQAPIQNPYKSTPQYSPSVTPIKSPSDSPQQYPQQTHSKSGEKFGNLSILFVIIGSLMPFLIIGSIVTGYMGLNRDEDPTLSKIGLVSAGVVAFMWIFLFAIVIVLIFS